MMAFRRIIILGFHLFFSLQLISQVIEPDPVFFTRSSEVTITFHADRGASGLKDYNGEIYAHTGVITNKSTGDTDWKYVKAQWNQNIHECKLTKTAPNTYQLKLTPSVEEFYNVPANEKIKKLAFVFRSEDGSLEGKNEGGKDIYLEVSDNGLDIRTNFSHKKWHLIEQDSIMSLSVNTNQPAEITLQISHYDTTLSLGQSLSVHHLFDTEGLFLVKGIATTENEVVSDSTYVFIQPETIEASMPFPMEDGINYLDSNKVGLVLFAPNKQNVFLLGDFNNWLPSEEYQLNKQGDHWWIIIDGLEENTEYAFQYLVDGNLLIADPYTEKVLDPWNDPHIPESVYPNLKAYPEGKTTGLVSIIHTNKPKYDWNIKSFTPVDQQNLVIYELLIRDFVETHAIKDVQEKLDYLQELGVNAIELMPFNEFEGNNSWGYNPSFYFAPDKYYGTEFDYKAFIDECHARGMAVLMDIVFNHAYNQCSLVQLYFDNENNRPSTENPWFNATSPNDVYSWGNDFNHESEYTRAFVDRVLEFWMTEYKIDGFRFDFTKGMTNIPGDGWAYDASRISLLRRYFNTMNLVDRDAILICEHLAAKDEETVLANSGILLWGNMNHSFNEATMGYLNNSDFSWASYQTRGWNQPNLISYMESHDEERLMYKNLQYGNEEGDYSTKDFQTAIDRNKLASVFYFAIPGPKMIWQFGELGYDFSIDHNGRVGEKPIRWDYLEDLSRVELLEAYKQIIDLKLNNEAFQSSNFELNVGKDDYIKSIVLNSENQNIVVVGNFDMEDHYTTIPFTSVGNWYDMLTGDSINISTTRKQFFLEAGEYKVFSNDGSNIIPVTDTTAIDIKVYPNPASDYIILHSETAIEEVKFYSMTSGKFIVSFSDIIDNYIELPDLEPGAYLMAYKTNEITVIQKFLKN